MGALGLILLTLLEGQPQESATEPREKKRIELDFSDQYKMSEDLEKSLRWKKLFPIFGVSEVHIYPGRESGPYLGPRFESGETASAPACGGTR
jgi:hypothetical protein